MSFSWFGTFLQGSVVSVRLPLSSVVAVCDCGAAGMWFKNPGVGCHSLLQSIIPIQGSNPDFLHFRLILYHLSHWGSSDKNHVACKIENIYYLQLCSESVLFPDIDNPRDVSGTQLSEMN